VGNNVEHGMAVACTKVTFVGGIGRMMKLHLDWIDDCLDVDLKDLAGDQEEWERTNHSQVHEKLV
jgi:hypothetical protein